MRDLEVVSLNEITVIVEVVSKACEKCDLEILDQRATFCSDSDAEGRYIGDDREKANVCECYSGGICEGNRAQSNRA